MKRIRVLYFISLLLLIIGCKEDEFSRIEPQGDFAVNFTLPEGEITAPAKVLLTNRSKYSEKFLWKFPQGKALTKEGFTDRSFSETLVPDTIYYNLPGEYKVTLVAWQGGKIDSVIKTVNVVKMQPQIVMPSNIGIMAEVEFSANVFKFPGQEGTYSWDFGEPGLVSTDANPKVTFQNEGLHTITLAFNDGEETLTSTVQVTVMGELTKALYFTDIITKKVYKYQFKQLKAPVITQLPHTLGVHPLSLSVYNNRVFITETGNNAWFANSANADGRIYSTDLAGTNEVTLSTATGTYQQDPFAHDIDPATGTLYFLTRNFNVRAIPAAGQDVSYPTTQRLGIVAGNAADVTSVFNWVDGGVRVVGGEIWYSKHANGKGLYRFNAATNTFIGRVESLRNAKVRSFAVDSENQKIYFYINTVGGDLNPGLYRCNIDGSSIVLIDNLSSMSQEGSGTEILGITGMAIDTSPDDGSAGYLYYGFRAASDINNLGAVVGTGANSGIKQYALDGSKPAEFLIRGYAPYGIGVDHTKR